VYICGFYPHYRKALKTENDSGVKVYRIFYGNKLTLKLSRHNFLGRYLNIKKEFDDYINFINQFIHKNKIDIIEIPTFNEAFRYSGPAMIMFPNFCIPKVVKYHGTYTNYNNIINGIPLNKSLYEKEKNLILNATKLIALSENTKKNMAEIFKITSNVTVIYNGVNSISDIICENNSVKKDVVFAGTICKNKGLFSLIRAWEKVISNIPSAKLFIYGKGSKKDINKIRNLITKKTRDSIELKGFVDKNKLPIVYSKSSCAIFPSYQENFSMAPMESMQVGCPTIFTKRSSGPELIEHRKNGLLVDPDDILEISNAIVLLLTDRKYAMKIGSNGRKTIEEKFNITNIADAHIKFYREII